VYIERKEPGAMPKRRKRMQHLRNQTDYPARRPEISLRLPQKTFDLVQSTATEYGVDYESLIKIWLVEKLSARIKLQRRGSDVR
jgi:hypothetical protein